MKNYDILKSISEVLQVNISTLKSNQVRIRTNTFNSVDICLKYLDKYPLYSSKF